MAYVVGRVMTLLGKQRLPGDVLSDEESRQVPHIALMMSTGDLHLQGSEPANLKAKAPAPEHFAPAKESTKAPTTAEADAPPAESDTVGGDRSTGGRGRRGARG